MKKKGINAITLVSLSIVIIILIILAGVAVTGGRKNIKKSWFTNVKYKYVVNTSKGKNCCW